MYLEELPKTLFTTTKVKIRYDCCGKEHVLKWADAKKNFEKNKGKHICRLCLLKHNNPAKRQEVREKMKVTNLERYGASCPLNTPEKIAERTGPMSEEDKAKREEVRKQTCIEKYGADHPMKTDEGKQKVKDVFQGKYGCDYPMQNEEVKERARQTTRERYGVDNVLSSPEVRTKAAQTTLEKYGVEHYNQLPEMRDYLREHCSEWLKEVYESGGPNKGITRPEEWNEKQRATITKLIEGGEWKAGHKNSWHGHYKADKCKRPVSFFRSGFELIYHWHLDHDPKVEWYHYEPFYIPYTKIDGSPARYFPDFLVKYLNDDLLYLREVKADYLHDSEEVKTKYNAAMEYILDKQMKFDVLLKRDVEALGIKFDDLLLSDRVSITHDPRHLE